jgi:apolipoprotein N-acyltransferase
MERLAGSIILLTGWRKSLLAMAAGALTVLIQAPFDFPASAFLTFPVLVLLLDGAVPVGKTSLLGRLKPAFAVGWWFGFGYFVAGLWWIGGALLVEADAYAWALPFAVVGLPILLAFFYGFACALARVLWNDGIGRIFALSFGFGLTEWLRAFVLTGFPWIPIGYGLMPSPLLMQSVGVVGTLGMNALAVFVFASPVLLIAGRRSLFGPLLAVILIVLHVGFGAWSLSRPSTSELAPIAVRVVQPNIDLADKWDNREANFKKLLELSSMPPTEGAKPPQLIVWPETSVPYILSEAPGALAAIGDMLKPGQTLLAGSVRQEGAEADSARYYNAVLMIDDSGQIVDAVDKNHLVPFGEYLPLQAIFTRFGITQLISGPTNYEAGVTRHPLVVGDAKIAAYICYEIIFPELMPRPRDAVNIVLNVTNDAWFGDTPGPYQHLRQTQLRAVEVGRPVIRAANTGISAVIDPFGQVSDALAMGVQGIIDQLVRPDSPSPRPWSDGRRNGLVILAVFGVLAAGFRVARRR